VEIGLESGRFYIAQVSPVPGVGKTITIQDITHFKELDNIKNEFVHTVSHDLRSPLTAILGYVELIERVGEINAQQKDFIRRVQTSVQNITELINALLELGRIEAGFDQKKEPVPIPMIVQYAVDGLQHQFEQKGHEVIVDMHDHLPPVFGNPVRLRQMINNLLENAIKYTPDGGQVFVRARAEGDQIILQIQDTGVGIPPADQPYIFDKLYRASNVPMDSKGTGLGLAIVKSIVENHEGRLWFDSNLGRGTTFTVVLPALAEVGG
jgi:two-component system NtrC family sensor kinase